MRLDDKLQEHDVVGSHSHGRILDHLHNINNIGGYFTLDTALFNGTRVAINAFSNCYLNNITPAC